MSALSTDTQTSANSEIPDLHGAGALGPVIRLPGFLVAELPRSEERQGQTGCSACTYLPTDGVCAASTGRGANIREPNPIILQLVADPSYEDPTQLHFVPSSSLAPSYQPGIVAIGSDMQKSICIIS